MAAQGRARPTAAAWGRAGFVGSSAAERKRRRRSLAVDGGAWTAAQGRARCGEGARLRLGPSIAAVEESRVEAGSGCAGAKAGRAWGSAGGVSAEYGLSERKQWA